MPVDVKTKYPFVSSIPASSEDPKYHYDPSRPSSNVYNYFHDCPENVYFPYTASNSIHPEIARFKGITPRRRP